VPTPWADSVDAHRSSVRDAVLDATAALVAERGLAAVTMSGIAGRSGIGRATLYRHFPDVESVLSAWHARQIEAHRGRLAGAAGGDGPAAARLEAVLRAWARIARESRGHRDADLAAVLHRDGGVDRTERHLHSLVASLIEQAAADGDLRADAPPGELAAFCLHALTAASGMPDERAADRLVAVALAGLRPAPPAA
jgi:AcrR family transcriptional regulator